MKIAFLTIATNKYNIFADIMAKSLDEHCKLFKFDLFVFGNTDLSYKPSNFLIKKHYITHAPHPLGTLLRYHYYLEKIKSLNEYDYLFHIDCDMKLVSNVDKEILGDRVCTLHPGWFMRSDVENFPYDRNKDCTAYVDVNDPRVKPGHMYQNCFQGGNKDEFIKMATSIRDNCEIDLRKNIIALWHDESYMNKYMLENSPTKILSPGYAYPEKWNIDVEPKIVHLDKDHLNIRKSD